MIEHIYAYIWTFISEKFARKLDEANREVLTKAARSLWTNEITYEAFLRTIQPTYEALPERLQADLNEALATVESDPLMDQMYDELDEEEDRLEESRKGRSFLTFRTQTP